MGAQQAGAGAGPLRRAARTGDPEPGGLPYTGFAEFEAALDVLAQPAVAAALGAAGRRYVERHYTWPVVMDRYEELLALAIRRRGAEAAGAVPAGGSEGGSGERPSEPGGANGRWR